jgi:hypothetical protein
LNFTWTFGSFCLSRNGRALPPVSDAWSRVGDDADGDVRVLRRDVRQGLHDGVGLELEDEDVDVHGSALGTVDRGLEVGDQ